MGITARTEIRPKEIETDVLHVRIFYGAAASGRQSPPIRLCCVSVTLDEPEQDVHVVFLASLL
jgi:hypothetical protein